MTAPAIEPRRKCGGAGKPLISEVKFKRSIWLQVKCIMCGTTSGRDLWPTLSDAIAAWNAAQRRGEQ